MSAFPDQDAATAYGAGLLRGERTRLRPATEHDLAAIDTWWNDPAQAVLQHTTVLPRPAGAAAEALRGWSTNATAGAVGFAVVEIALSDLDPDAATVLVLEWSGDVARLEIGGVLVADQFWSGRSWEIDLAPWREALASSPARVRILPWREDSTVFVDARVRDRRVPGRASVDSASLLTAPRHRLDLGSLAG